MPMKILVDVFVPAISEHFDVLIPDFLTTRELTLLIVDAVKEMSNNQYISSGGEFLCMSEKQLVLDEENVIGEYGIKNGDHLVLI